MNPKNTVFALVALALVATCLTHKEGHKGGKGGKMDKLHQIAKCMPEEILKAKGVMMMNSTFRDCAIEAGMVTSSPAPTGRPGKQGFKPNMCFVECVWKKDGLVKDGSFQIEEYVKTNIKSEFQSAYSAKFQECLTKKELTLSYTTSKDDKCKGLEKHFECINKAAKVCKGKNERSSTARSATVAE